MTDAAVVSHAGAGVRAKLVRSNADLHQINVRAGGYSHSTGEVQRSLPSQQNIEDALGKADEVGAGYMACVSFAHSHGATLWLCMSDGNCWYFTEMWGC